MKGYVVRKYVVTIGSYLRDKPINGIKALRLTFNLGLYDAKQMFDEIRQVGKSIELSTEDAMKLESEGFTVSPIGQYPRVANREVTVYIPDNGRKIEAIKKLRSATGMGLKESKDMLDMMWEYNRPVSLTPYYTTDMVISRLIEQGFQVTGFVHECFKENEDLFVI